MFNKPKLSPLVLIAVPAYDKVWAETATCVLNLAQNGFYRSIVSFFRGSLIHRARNQMAEAMLNHPAKPDYLLFVDSDMLFKEDALEKLLFDHKDIVTGNAFSRQWPVKPVVGRFDPDKPGLVHSLVDYQREKLQPVDSVGMAFTLISRNALEKVGPKPFNFLFMESGYELGEDSAFCWRAREAGLQPWLDSRVQLGHIGDVIYDERDFEAGKEELEKTLTP